jgi:hypothetical protein
MQVQLHGHPGKNGALPINVAEVTKEAYTNRVEINCCAYMVADLQK